ncbi:MAG: glycerol-3-phosphate acyltransferase [Armatimonadetes bacterium]|nr:glycerol-3-phosphate acyltransferase [Armatimonadota bacterium]
MNILLLAAGAYLIGSTPSGYLLVRACRGVDVRAQGSHGIGAINVCRVGGLRLGVLTLLADVGKGTLVVVAAHALTADPWAICAAAFAVLLGHAFSIWLRLREGRFSEGKSVASTLGVLLGLGSLGELPWSAVVAPVGVWGIGLLLPRVLMGRWWCVSPATVAATLSIPLAVHLARPAPAYSLLAGLMAALVLVRHKENFRRLRAGTEPLIASLRPSRRA